MDALIQHNVNAGLGDYTHTIYRYFYLVEGLRKIGYNKITLYINMTRSTMFNSDYFFMLYNRKEFELLFDEIVISNNKIDGNDYENVSFFYVNGNNETGINQFDLFVDFQHEKHNELKNNLGNFFPENTLKKYRNLFSDYVMEKYREINKYKGEEYLSIHFRAKDGQDNVDLYIDHEDEFKNIIFGNNKVFICSNSYKFKEYIKSFNSSNVFMYEIPDEKEHGNHLSALQFTDEFGVDEYHEKTLYTAIDMLTLSQSTEIYSFNYFGNVFSNFLNLSKSKGVKINIMALKNGMNWKP
jgi:hypothetical protein